jgi:hypothetical protein
MPEGSAQSLPPGHADLCDCDTCEQHLTIPDRPPEASPDPQGSLEARARMQDFQRPYDRRYGTTARQADVGD